MWPNLAFFTDRFVIIFFEFSMIFQHSLGLFFFSISNNDCNVLALCFLSFFLNNIFFILFLLEIEMLQKFLIILIARDPSRPSHVKNA